jgi:hypothetical protein
VVGGEFYCLAQRKTPPALSLAARYSVAGQVSEQWRLSHRVEQAETVDIGGAAVAGAHRAVGAQRDQLAIAVGHRAMIGLTDGDDVHHFRVPSTCRADDFSGQHSSYSKELISLSSAAENRRPATGHGAVAPRLALAAIAAAALADAVRDRSLCAPRPASQHWLVPISFFVTLTPARWQAINLVGKSWRPIGSGEAVLARTDENQRQNQQPIEIAAFSVRFSRFSRVASRHAYAHTYTDTRAHVRGVKHRTTEPTNFIVINHRVSGSKVGSARFCLEPASDGAALNGGKASLFNIIAGEYAASPRSGVRKRGGWRKVSGISGRSALPVWAIGLDRDQLWSAWRSLAGMADFCGFGRTDRAMLEGQCWSDGLETAQMRRLRESLASLSGLARSVSGAPGADRQPGRGRGSDRPGRPPVPPFAAGQFPCSLAHEPFRFSIDLSSHGARPSAARQKNSRSLAPPIGSGKRWVVPLRPKNRGKSEAAEAGGGVALRRAEQSSGGMAHVN